MVDCFHRSAQYLGTSISSPSSSSSSAALMASDRQEDEWNRAETFTAWCNSHLRKAGTRIDAIEEDFQNGLKLMLLLEVISGEALPRPDRGKTRFHRIANVNKALGYIQSRGVKLVSLGAEEVVDGNVKMTLGLVWTIILRFAIQEITIGDLSARDGLLLWCQRKTENYPQVNIHNFSTSWKDGLAFCALIHRHRPDLIDFPSLSSTDPIGNLNLAFDVADQHLDIPRMLDPEDVAIPESPDEKSVMTYVSSFYHTFEENPQLNGIPLDFRRRSVDLGSQYPFSGNYSNGFSQPNGFSHRFPQTNGFSHLNGFPQTNGYPMPLRMTQSMSDALIHEPKPIRFRIPRSVSRESTPIRVEPIRQRTPLRQQVAFQMPTPPPLSAPIRLNPCPDPREMDKAANRIQRVLAQNRQNDSIAEEFEQMAENLKEWIKKWKNWMSQRSAEESLTESKNRLEELRNYRKTEKPKRIEEKSRLETLLNSLQIRLRLGNRPPFQPKNGHNLTEISADWELLEKEERKLEDWLLRELLRIEHLIEKFRRKCALHDEWRKEKEKPLESEDFRRTDIHGVKALQKRHEASEADRQGHSERVDQIIAIGTELRRLQYREIEWVDAKCSAILSDWGNLEKLATERGNRLAEAEIVADRLDSLQLQFAKLVSPFHNWVGSVREDLSDYVIAHEMREISQLIAEHSQFKATLVDAAQSLDSIADIDQNIHILIEEKNLDSSLRENPYSAITLEALDSLWRDVAALIPQRDAQLETERERQKTNDRLRNEYAELAESMAPWLERQLDAVREVGREGPLEDAVIHIRSLQKKIGERREDLEKLERIHQRMQEALVVENKVPMETLRVHWDSLNSSLRRVLNEIENQILLRDGKGIAEKEIADFRSAFNHFDKDRTGLTEDQLKAFLIAIGQQSRVDNDGESIPQRLIANSMGRFSFDSLLDFLTRENLDEDSAAQMAESFRILASGNPKISAAEIRRELSTEDADYILRRVVAADDDSLDYEHFSRALYLH